MNVIIEARYVNKHTHAGFFQGFSLGPLFANKIEFRRFSEDLLNEKAGQCI